MMKKYRPYFLMISLFIMCEVSHSREFNNCPADAPGRTELDNVCPRLEGIHLPECCPQKFKTPPLVCKYHIIKDHGQPYLRNNSYTKCVNGSNQNFKCCSLSYKACLIEPITKNYLPRLIYRSNQCCYESCPPAEYWRSPPKPDASFSKDHVLTNAGNVCISQTIDECDYGSSTSCEADDPCPIPAPAPAPAPNPNPAPSPSPTSTPKPPSTTAPPSNNNPPPSSSTPSNTSPPPPPPPPPVLPDGT